MLGDIEILDLTRDLRGKGLRVEAGDARDARASRKDVSPSRFEAETDRRNDPHSGDDDAALRHGQRNGESEMRCVGARRRGKAWGRAARRPATVGLLLQM